MCRADGDRAQLAGGVPLHQLGIRAAAAPRAAGADLLAHLSTPQRCAISCCNSLMSHNMIKSDLRPQMMSVWIRSCHHRSCHTYNGAGLAAQTSAPQRCAALMLAAVLQVLCLPHPLMSALKSFPTLHREHNPQVWPALHLPHAARPDLQCKNVPATRRCAPMSV